MDLANFHKFGQVLQHGREFRAVMVKNMMFDRSPVPFSAGGVPRLCGGTAAGAPRPAGCSGPPSCNPPPGAPRRHRCGEQVPVEDGKRERESTGPWRAQARRMESEIGIEHRCSFPCGTEGTSGLACGWWVGARGEHSAVVVGHATEDESPKCTIQAEHAAIQEAEEVAFALANVAAAGTQRVAPITGTEAFGRHYALALGSFQRRGCTWIPTQRGNVSANARWEVRRSVQPSAAVARLDCRSFSSWICWAEGDARGGGGPYAVTLLVWVANGGKHLSRKLRSGSINIFEAILMFQHEKPKIVHALILISIIMITTIDK